MLPIAEISFIPDLTHPDELLQFGQQLIATSRWLIILLLAVGIVLAIINISYRNFRSTISDTTSLENRPIWLDLHLTGYGQLLRGLMHSILIMTILVTGFFFCSTLANRYHHWEQDKIAQVADSVTGDRLEQSAPIVRYTVDEPYKEITYINGKPTEVDRTRPVDRFLSPSTSQAEVKLTQATDPATLRFIYQSEFKATYEVKNTLEVTENFTFEAAPPFGYTLLQDYLVDQDGQRLEPVNQGDYRFPIKLRPGRSSQFHVTYKAQGAPRWVYNANGNLLSKFRLTVLADFPNADFASGIIPTETKSEGNGTRFTWAFAENVAVQNPFGVFTATQRFSHTGVLPRLLLLAPGILLWWLLLLYLLVPMRWQDVAIASGIFFACLLSLTYASRLIDAKLAWALVFPLLLLFGWSLGRRREQRWRSLGATFSGAVLPVLGFLVPYTGLTLSIAGLSSIGWLINSYWKEHDQEQENNLSRLEE